MENTVVLQNISPPQRHTCIKTLISLIHPIMVSIGGDACPGFSLGDAVDGLKLADDVEFLLLGEVVADVVPEDFPVLFGGGVFDQ